MSQTCTTGTWVWVWSYDDLDEIVSSYSILVGSKCFSKWRVRPCHEADQMPRSWSLYHIQHVAFDAFDAHCAMTKRSARHRL
jgi:hypothetical protein